MAPIRGPSNRPLHFVASILLGLVAAGCDGGVTGPSGQPQDQLLVLVHQPGQMPPYLRVSDIYRINADGTGAVNLTSSPAVYGGLDLSPDGSTIAFTSNPGSGGRHVWLMSTDGTGRRRITTDGFGSNRTPRWSADGTRIAYTHSAPGGPATVFVVPAGGGTTIDVSSEAIAADAPCSDDQKRLQLIGWTADDRVLFSNYICGVGHRHYIVNGDGSNPSAWDLDPFTSYWSPDGSSIALTSNGAVPRLMIMAADGSNLRELTDHPGDLRLPSRTTITQYRTDYDPWSPGGSELVFEERSDGLPTFVLNAIGVNGSGLRPLTDLVGEFNGWSPDGDRIAFSSMVSGTWNVYVVNADGTGLINITESAGEATNAIWLPHE